MRDRRDLLLILDDMRGADAIITRWHVRQRISPRVFTVEAGIDDRSELAAIEGVRAVLASGDKATDEMRRGLTTNEIFFVDAYTRRSAPAAAIFDQFVFSRTPR